MTKVQDKLYVMLTDLQADHIYCKQIIAKMQQDLSAGHSRAEPAIKELHDELEKHLRRHPRDSNGYYR